MKQPRINPYEDSLYEDQSEPEIAASRLDDLIIDGYHPTIPAAHPDGTVPNDAIAEGLLVHAPIISVDGHHSWVGNEFDLVIDGKIVPGTTAIYKETDLDFVVLRMPRSFGEALAEGFHDVAYRDKPVPTGLSVQSESTQILIDRTPAGSRRLPRIEFPLVIQREGISLATLLSMPDETLRGTIPGYAGFEVTDTLHVCMRPKGGTEIPLVSVPATPEGDDVVALSFTESMLASARSNGVVDFYYYVEDKATNRSKASTSTPISLFIVGAPRLAIPPTISASRHGLVTDAEIKPVLRVGIPAINPRARKGDVIVLDVGGNAFRAVRLTESQADSDPMANIDIPYDDVWDTIADGLVFSETFSYTHYHNGVPTRSASKAYAFDLSVPGGRDPLPKTPENEALLLPVLHSASGKEENYVGFDDAEHDARVAIGVSPFRSTREPPFHVGDTVTVFLKESAVGAPHVVTDPSVPIAIVVPSDDLKANAGSVYLSYSVERVLSHAPSTSLATSLPQLVRIESADGLPGAGLPLQGAVFVDARRLEDATGTYAVHERDLVKKFTPIRVYGYANMAEGDVLTIEYEGYNAWDGGSRVPEASGSITHEIVAVDLLPKDDDLDGSTGEAIFVDVRMDSSVVYTLAFGRFQSSYTIKNHVGSAKATSRTVLVSARVPKP
ncbi:MAG TPA: hypothetical protein VGN46_13595 [Luteibacter sp.]|uniref:hypothetical protein n=1 Tax=Luteibacter sp. TaxID=1886636 RepID=UPI002F40BE61